MISSLSDLSDEGTSTQSWGHWNDQAPIQYPTQGKVAQAPVQSKVAQAPVQSKVVQAPVQSKVVQAPVQSRVFNIDITRCPCGGELRVVAAICDPDEARRYLRHVGLPSDPPARAPPQYKPLVMDFDAGPAADASTVPMTSSGWE